jgi:uncharacterized damage-inducible protein DinB
MNQNRSQNRSQNRPDLSEHLPYYGKYIALVPPGDIFATLGQELETTLSLLRSLTPAQADHRYAPDKWSLKEVVGHLIDTERIFAYRAMRFARNDQTPLSGFDENAYVPAAKFGGRALDDLAAEFEHVRKANLFLFRGMDDDAWRRKGVANGAEVSVRALAWIIAGHEIHHREILRTRYL